MKKLLKMMFSRLAFVAIFMILQVAAVLATLTYFRNVSAVFYCVFLVIAVIVVIYIINSNGNPAYKLAWAVPIVVAPLFGIPLYFIFGKSRLPTRSRVRASEIARYSREAMRDIAAPVSELPPDARHQAAYLENIAPAPGFRGTETEYFPVGDVMFPKMLEALRGAEKYIFLEYFIIAPGHMWSQVLEILEQKVAAGIDVRVIYDDMGSISTLPSDYAQQLEKKGIKCRVFHRFQPVLNGTFNNRDHRKILAVDGRVAFTGGINLADEYINELERFGHWLDCGVMLRGRAAYSFAVMFLSMWDYLLSENEVFSDFRPDDPGFSDLADDGFVQPYADSPSDDERVGETVYLNMINRANRYVYICTPYLVLDDELHSALCNAAKAGVDVRIITPGIPDKWYVYQVTRSYYASLVRAGVKVYEYTPGFIHSKTCVVDDDYGVCGTINFDFRSLYLHHECAVWMYKSRAITQMRDSFLSTLEKCGEVTQEICASRKLPTRIVQSLLRLFAPLM